MQDSAAFEEAVAFVAVAELGSFAAAGARLQRDPTVVSRRVSALERRLGVRLLNRTTRQLTLTEAGRLYADQARRAVTALAEAEAETQRLGEPRGLLRVSAPATFGRMWLAPALPRFLSLHPAVRLEISFSNAYEDLAAKSIDAAVRIGVLPDSSLVARRLAPRRRMVVASPAYLEGRGRPDTPAGLIDHACLLFSGLSDFPHWTFAQNGRRISTRVSGPLISDDTESLLRAALDGAGLLQCADWLAGEHLRAGRLVTVLDSWAEQDHGGVFAVTPAAGLMPGKTRAFLDWLAESFSPAPWIDPG